MSAPEGGVDVAGGADDAAWLLQPGVELPPLRLGFEIPLARGLAERASWFGRGPHESYPDPPRLFF